MTTPGDLLLTIPLLVGSCARIREFLIVTLAALMLTRPKTSRLLITVPGFVIVRLPWWGVSFVPSGTPASPGLVMGLVIGSGLGGLRLEVDVAGTTYPLIVIRALARLFDRRRRCREPFSGTTVVVAWVRPLVLTARTAVL